MQVDFGGRFDILFFRTDVPAVPDYLVHLGYDLILVFAEGRDVDARQRERDFRHVGLVRGFGRQRQLRQVAFVGVFQVVLFHERIVGLRFLLAGVDGQLRLCRQSSETDGQQQDGSDYFHRFTEFMHE